MKKWYQLTSDEVLVQFGTRKEGLTEEEIAAIRMRVGNNTLQEEKQKGILIVFLEQFKDLLVIILIIAAIISGVTDNMESSIVIGIVLILNAVLGAVQHKKAEKSLASLRALSSPHAKVLRGNVKQEIISAEIVPGDLVYLEAGDMVVADGRLIQCFSLQVNESSLTGESVAVEKAETRIDQDVVLAERTNMVYSGSLVTYGRAVMVVTETGMNTEMGKIAGLLNKTKRNKTPLQIGLDRFGARLAIVIIIICILVFGLSLYRGMNLLDALLFAVALAVAAIPEALNSIVTIVQAIGTSRMAKENAIIKELKAVETLGCVSVICSDKTGTLTQNKMEVKEIYLNGEILQPKQMSLRNPLHRFLLYNAVLTNDSSIVNQKKIGDPTESALIEMFEQIMANPKECEENEALNAQALREMIPRLEELPFDSDRKRMSIKCSLHGKSVILTKGAVDVLLSRCEFIRLEEGCLPMTNAFREAITDANTQFSMHGLRVLAFAYRETDAPLTFQEEQKFTFLGLIAMMDPPRPESLLAVADARLAGIQPVMITGDHKITAMAIAGEIGIFQEGDTALTGAQLDEMSDEDFLKEVEHISVYARVSPENKIRIVDAWQKKGNIVAMTGDGVNDAPALKRANVGVAMGITGTEVSKDAAAMILTDDNFATIIKAIANGRNVYRNIKNAILFLLSGNMAGILAVLYTCFAKEAPPFAAVHLLFINLVTDSLPALAIGMEPTEHNLIKDKPRPPKEGILTVNYIGSILVQGALIAVATLGAFYMGAQTNFATASTMAFATLTLARLFHGFNCRSKQPLIRIGFRNNWYSLGAFGIGILLLGSVLEIPFLQRLFSIEPLAWSSLLVVLCLSITPTVLIQAYKMVQNLFNKK